MRFSLHVLKIRLKSAALKFWFCLANAASEFWSSSWPQPEFNAWLVGFTFGWSSGASMSLSHGCSKCFCHDTRRELSMVSMGLKKDHKFFACHMSMLYFCWRTSSMPQYLSDLMCLRSPFLLKYVLEFLPFYIMYDGIFPNNSIQSAKWSSSLGYSSLGFGSNR